VGRAELLHRHGVVIDKKIMEAAAGQTHTFVAIGGQLAGVISLQDDIRPDGRRAIARLHRNGIRDIYLVTGDTAPVAKRVAKQVGIALKQVAVQALPVDKLQLIEKTVRRPAAFVGDSASDAPALAAADVGIALGATGPTAASHAADIIIPSDSLLKVADAHAISLRTFSTARRSIVLGTILNIGLIILFATGRIPPIYGVAAQGLVDAVVLYNALRARRG
jgi:P-type E1-E2 ATPase